MAIQAPYRAAGEGEKVMLLCLAVVADNSTAEKWDMRPCERSEGLESRMKLESSS